MYLLNLLVLCPQISTYFYIDIRTSTFFLFEFAYLFIHLFALNFYYFVLTKKNPIFQSFLNGENNDHSHLFYYWYI